MTGIDPNQIDLNERQPQRQMKKTLASEHGKYIRKLKNKVNPNRDNHKKLIKTVHTDCVRTCINK